MGNGVAAADGREGNPRKRGGTDATLYGGSSTFVPHGGLLLLSDAGRKASRGVNGVRRWKEGRTSWATARERLDGPRRRERAHEWRHIRRNNSWGLFPFTKITREEKKSQPNLKMLKIKLAHPWS